MNRSGACIVISDVLARLEEDLAQMNPAQAPDGEDDIGCGDNEVGTLTDDRLKCLLALIVFYQTQKDAALARAEAAGADEDEGPLNDEVNRNQSLMMLAHEIYSFELREAFGLHSEEGVSVRKGWKVVWFDAECQSCQGYRRDASVSIASQPQRLAC